MGQIMHKYSTFLFGTFFLLAGFFAPLVITKAQAIESRADYALLMDVNTGVVLFEKNGAAPMTPASMSKLMTVLMVFDALKHGTLSLEDTLFVSDNAWRKGGAKSGGSTMFLKARSRVSVENLLRGIVVQSGNDACIVIAEGLAGSEEDFALAMNDRAAELGMTTAYFTNSTGLPEPEHKMSARDLAILANTLVTDYGAYYSMFSERDFTWNGIRQGNRNPLLYANIGADGLKTGHTRESGYGLVASGEQNGRRLILVMNGLDSKKERAAEARRFMNWGFRAFTPEVLVEGGAVVRALPVWHGDSAAVNIAPKQRFQVLVPRGKRGKMAITLTYDRPIHAPIKAGDALGILRVTLPNMPPQEIAVVAADDVGRGNFISRALDSLGYLLFGGNS